MHEASVKAYAADVSQELLGPQVEHELTERFWRQAQSDDIGGAPL
jgi:hypothetical protein